MKENKIGGGGIGSLLSTRIVLLRSLVQGNFSGEIVDKKNLPLDAVGGGLFIHNGSAVLNESELKENRARSTGGGIQNEGDLVLRFSRITRNKAQDGGGIFTTRPFVKIDSKIVENEPNNVVTA